MIDWLRCLILPNQHGCVIPKDEDYAEGGAIKVSREARTQMLLEVKVGHRRSTKLVASARKLDDALNAQDRAIDEMMVN